MQEQNLPKLTLGNKEIPFSEIIKKFSSTDWGEKLKGNVRYIKHKPEKIENKIWNKILGGDINNLDHLVVTKVLASSFLKGCDNPGKEWKEKIPEEAHFSPEEQQLLLLTATVHDWAEAIKGDISYYEKTERDDYEEMWELRAMINKMLGEILEEEKKEEIEKLAEEVVEILTHTDSKLGKAFNAIERVGYVRTSLRAYNESEKANEKLKVPLKNMACRVMSDQVRILVDYAKIYPPVSKYIKYHEKIIDKIFADGENPEIRASIPRFEESKKKWLARNT